jgi:hypothetical protein
MRRSRSATVLPALLLLAGCGLLFQEMEPVGGAAGPGASPSAPERPPDAGVRPGADGAR